jgi:hypothetical protein
MIYFPPCATCSRFRTDGDGFTCDAFPRGIPAAILRGENDHTSAYPGDNGLTYISDEPWTEPAKEGRSSREGVVSREDW